jgi:CRP/FNR family cyclic AMP-dependent transcriptional regulator
MGWMDVLAALDRDAWIEAIGWIAAGATLVTYAMRTMLPLRAFALGSNFFFLIYGALEGIYPTMVMNALLLPINLYRIYDIRRTTQLMKDMRVDQKAFEWLRPLLKPVKVADGEYLFRKGDAPDCLYIMRSGKVLLEEIDVTLEGEQIFGEIAFFTDERERTVSAKCIGDCQIMRVDEAAFMRLYNQNPAFGLYIVKLTASRLLDGLQRNPEVYLKSTLSLANPPAVQPPA